MGRLTDEPFSPSCCDGGATSNAMSAQVCGCDPGANWMCKVHKTKIELVERLLSNGIEDYLSKAGANASLEGFLEHVKKESQIG